MITETSAGVYVFDLHGIELRCEAYSPAFIGPAVSSLRRFRVAEGKNGTSLTIRFHQVADRREVPVNRSADARILFSGICPSRGNSLRSIWRCDIIQDGDRLVAEFPDQGLLVIDGERGYVEGYLFGPETTHEDFCESLFHFALTQLLKRQGVFCLHAAGLEYQGRGVIIPGGGGQGKTTLMLALLRSGFRYLSDDCPLVRERGAQMELLPLPMPIEVTGRTVEVFPELRGAGSGILRQGVWKKSFDPHDLYRDCSGSPCRPAMMLFPHIVDLPHSCLEPLSKPGALEALMAQPRVAQEPETVRREFLALSRLVQQVDSYRVHFGRDILELSSQVAPLLELRKSA